MENKIKNKTLFKSPGFFKKYPDGQNVYQTQHEKIFLLLVFLNLFLMFTIIFFSLGYATSSHLSVIPVYIENGIKHTGLNSASPSYDNPQELNQTLRTYRAMGLVFISWWIMVQFWLIKLGVDIFLSAKKHNLQYETKIGIIYFLSWISVYVPGLLVYELCQLKKMHLWKYCVHNLNQNTNYLTYIPNRHWTYYLAIGMLILMFPLMWFMIAPRISDGKLIFFGTDVGYGTNWWFFALHFFTEQSNLMCFICLLAFVINPQWKAFKNYDLWIVLMSYISIVSLAYNLMIFPVIASSYQGQPYDLTRTIWLHVIDPIAFLTIGCCLFFYNPTNQITPWGNTTKYGMIVPSVYSIYALFSPYATGVSPYAWLTNTNPALEINGHPGSWLCLIFFTIFMGFFVACITLWWYTNARLSIKKYSKLNLELNETKKPKQKKLKDIQCLNPINKQNIVQNQELYNYVMQVNEPEIQKLKTLANPVVCLLPTPYPQQTSNQIFFLDNTNKLIGTAKLLKIIHVPKQNIWNQIEPYTIINKDTFNQLYKNTTHASFAVLYDVLMSFNNKEMTDFHGIQYHQGIGLWKIKK